MDIIIVIAGWSRDLSLLELTACRIIHDEFKINREEQIELSGSAYRHIVVGVIETGGQRVVLDYDSEYYPSYR